jgi:hypothetical protein
LEKYFQREVVYLAGKLNQFEFPHELRIEAFNKKTQIKPADFFFPFLLTQAPIKPIIVSEQIRQYANALSILSSIDTLVVIGYSLCPNDNHIISMIREFILKQKNRVIYFEYIDKNKNTPFDEIRKNVKQSLRITDEQLQTHVTILTHFGDPGEAVSLLNLELTEAPLEKIG